MKPKHCQFFHYVRQTQFTCYFTNVAMILTTKQNGTLLQILFILELGKCYLMALS